MGDQAPAGEEILVAYTGAASTAARASSYVVAGGASGVFIDPLGNLVWGARNLTADPLFVDPGGADGDPDSFADNAYHLLDVSPAIDAADNLSAPLDATDI